MARRVLNIFYRSANMTSAVSMKKTTVLEAIQVLSCLITVLPEKAATLEAIQASQAV